MTPPIALTHESTFLSWYNSGNIHVYIMGYLKALHRMNSLQHNKHIHKNKTGAQRVSSALYDFKSALIPSLKY